MNIPGGLELTTFYCKDLKEIEKAELTGKPIPLNKISEKKITLYTIDVVEILEDFEDLCMVVSSGVEYQVNISYEKLNELIRERQTFRFN